MSELLKSIQHPKRLEILALLLREEKDFRTLMDKTGLPKSALGNHLSELVAKHLVEKITRGIYRITLDGNDYLASLSINFLNAKIREQERLERQRERNREMISKYAKTDIKYGEIVEKVQLKRSYTEMEVEIKKRGSFSVMGIQDRGNNSDFIPPMWDKFMTRYDEMKDIILSQASYGICFAFNKSTKEFNYLAGFEVNKNEKPLDGMSIFTIPEATYAIITCTLPKLKEAYKLVGDWIKENGYREIGKLEFELYPETWDDEKTDSMYVWVPVTRP